MIDTYNNTRNNDVGSKIDTVHYIKYTTSSDNDVALNSDVCKIMISM